MGVETKRNVCVGVLLWMLIILLAGFFLIGLGACRSVRYIPVERVHHDSVTNILYQRDSIYQHDSVFIRERADTVLVERWHTRWRDRVSHDTLYMSKVDTIRVPVPVERKLTKAERTFITIGKWSVGAVAGLVLAAICFIFFRSRWKFSS